MITSERVRELLEYNPETGVFTWKVHAGARTGNVAGTVTNYGYRRIKVGDGTYMAHRLAWLVSHGQHPKNDIDHIDGNRDFNAIENLRDVPRSRNLQNQRAARKDNKTGYLGVSYHKKNNVFVAQIGGAGRARYLGSFKNPEDAYQCYLEAKRLHHEGCTI